MIQRREMILVSTGAGDYLPSGMEFLAQAGMDMDAAWAAIRAQIESLLKPHYYEAKRRSRSSLTASMVSGSLLHSGL